jgi:hypothetical protein
MRFTPRELLGLPLRPLDENFTLINYYLSELGPEKFAETFATMSSPTTLSKPAFALGIGVTKPAKISVINRNPDWSSLGTFDQFPLEILYMILEFSTIQDLSRLCRASLRGNFIVTSLKIYRELIEYVPYVLAALVRTDLVGNHAAIDIYRSLRSTNCCFCNELGNYLWLPTCERCCISCIQHNSRLRILNLDQANLFFNVSRADMARSGIAMKSIPGKYGYNERFNRQKFIPVTALIQLATMIHGSLENLKSDLESRHLSRKLTTGAFSMAQEMLSANSTTEPPYSRPKSPTMLEGDEIHRIADLYPAMACMRFPVISEDENRETAIWCVGCGGLPYHRERATIWEEGAKTSFSSQYTMQSAYNHMRYVARTRTGFINHIKTYPCSRAISESFLYNNFPDIWKSWVKSPQNPVNQCDRVTLDS